MHSPLSTNDVSNSLWPVVSEIKKLEIAIDNLSNNAAKILDKPYKSFSQWTPKIAVIGSQSAGKTSLIEALSGLPPGTLPSGQGIVTKVPLHISIHDVSHMTSPNRRISSMELSPKTSDTMTSPPKSSDVNHNWVTFDHTSAKKTIDYADISDVIIKETNRILSEENPGMDASKCISSTPIRMHVFSVTPTAEISFIDLPGLVRIALHGQPDDVSKRLYNLSKEAISHENVIILALTPLNVDFANSEALTLAKAVDPNGLRTIGILTKADLIEDGVDVSKMLSGELLPLSLGYFAVVANGNIKNINKSSKNTRRQTVEAEFFMSTAPYKKLKPDLFHRCGVAKMTDFIVTILCSIVRELLPSLEKEVQHLVSSFTYELGVKKDPVRLVRGTKQLDTTTHAKSCLLHLLTSYSKNFTDLIDGKIAPSSDTIYGGAKIQQIFTEVFRAEMEEIDGLTGLSSNEISMAIKNAAGVKPSLFVPEQALETLVRKQLHLFERPCIRCVEAVYVELKSLLKATQVLTKEADPFRELQACIFTVCQNMLDQALPIARKFVQSLIEIEKSCIYTSNPSFQRLLFTGEMHASSNELDKEITHQQITVSPNKKRPVSMIPRHPVMEAFNKRLGDEILWVRQIVKCYLNIVRHNLLDSVPKSIMTYLVYEARENLSPNLVQALYDNEDHPVEELLKVSENQQAEISMLESDLEALEGIMDAILRVNGAIIKYLR